jgi:hypothetical protein
MEKSERTGEARSSRLNRTALANLDFGKGVLAKCDIALWRTRGEHLPLVGEFAFQVKFDRKEDIAAKQKKRPSYTSPCSARSRDGWRSA